ncbi:glutamyl-tRNA reductase-binding protein, chloroplastic isoform X1 [Cornus florida]|uniref:glutamyl-tRNA reductase-binding protein, chloroplastic isoform X1 n=1 Tax=Cornus florida TaxID=4283 RepID=UPI00289B2B3B|nr:glutamyl-tRNA reductase-binding protein, chloroplastic isoform X1 [Cornus florida]
MVLQTQSLTTHLLPSVLPTAHFSRPPLSLSKPTITTQFNISKPYPFRKSLVQPLKCSVSVVSEPTQLKSTSNDKPFPAEVSRTIMELSSVATLSTLTQDGWPLGIGVRFAVDSDGTPVLCLNVSNRQFSIDRRSSLHVQLEQCGLRTPQCTIQGNLDKPGDRMVLNKLHSIWKKKFEEEVDEDLIYVVAVERVLQIEDFKEDGIWVTSSDYRMANPDPLRDFAEKIVNEINIHNIEDIHRFCNIYVDLDFQVTEAKMVWVDRLGFDMRLSCPQNGIFEVRIPFPREVMDEKGAKSSFNCMSQRAWEVEKNYHAPDFKKVKQLKKIACRV